MKIAKKVAIAIDLNHAPPEILKSLRELSFLSHCELHFVSVYYILNLNYALSSYPLVYPIEEDRKTIEESTLAELKKFAKSVLPVSFEGRVSEHCLFSEDPKSRFCDFVKDHHIDLVITVTRQKRGIFESSFTNYVNKHTSANMLILKHPAS